MTLKFAREPAEQFWDEGLALLLEHWAEIAHYSDIPVEPLKERYHEMDDGGMLHVFTARDTLLDDAMVGYAVFIVVPHLHYGSSLNAAQDVLFLLPTYRSVGNGAALITFADQYLRGLGVQTVMHHTKLAHDFGPLLVHLGYEPMETIYIKRLDR